MEGISFKSHSSHFYFIQSVSQSFNQSCHSRNDGMRRNEGRFLKQGQTLNSENLLIPLSFCHSISLLYSSHGHSFHLKAIPAIWGSFLIGMSFRFEVDLKFIPCRRYTAFASKKFNPVLSPYRRQHQIKSFRCHSTPFKLIPISINVRSSHQNGMMLEWRNDVEMTGISEFSFFLPLQKQPHSSSFCHSNIIPPFLKWKGMKITMEGVSFKSHSSHLYFIPISPVIQEWRNEEEWREIFEPRPNP